jgi:hypothetical protein
MRGLARTLSVVGVLVLGLPALASAARSWQAPQPLASGVSVSAEASAVGTGSRERSIYLDNAGDALVEVGDNSGIAPYYRYLVRPHAGALGRWPPTPLASAATSARDRW